MVFSRRSKEPPSQQNQDRQPVRTRYALAYCIVCGHEQVRRGPGRSTCPDCGAAVSLFALYRDAAPARSPAQAPVRSLGVPRARLTPVSQDPLVG